MSLVHRVIDPLVSAIADVVRAELQRQHGKMVLEAKAAQARADDAEARAHGLKTKMTELAAELASEKRNRTIEAANAKHGKDAVAAEAAAAAAIADARQTALRLETVRAELEQAQAKLAELQARPPVDLEVWQTRDTEEPSVTLADLRATLIERAGADDSHAIRACLEWTGDDETGDVLIVDTLHNLCDALAASDARARAADEVRVDAGDSGGTVVDSKAVAPGVVMQTWTNRADGVRYQEVNAPTLVPQPAAMAAMTTTSPVVVQARADHAALFHSNDIAHSALESFAQGVSVVAVKQIDANLDDVRAAFAKTRALLPHMVEVYRGVTKGKPWKEGRRWLSWSPDRDLAATFGPVTTAHISRDSIHAVIVGSRRDTGEAYVEFLVDAGETAATEEPARQREPGDDDDVGDDVPSPTKLAPVPSKRTRVQDRSAVKKATQGAHCPTCNAQAKESCDAGLPGDSNKLHGGFHDTRWAAGRARLLLLDRALALSCPECGAAPETPCTVDGKKGMHLRRTTAAQVAK